MNQNAKYLILVSLVVLTFWLSRRPVPSSEISYSEFRQQLMNGNVDEVRINGSNIKGKFKKAYKDKDVFESTILDQELAKEFDQYKVKYEQEEPSPLLASFATFFIPLLFFWVIWFVLMKNSFKRGGGTFMTVGKSKAKIYVETNTKVTFKDVAGADEALEELSEIIDFLKEDEKVKELGGKMPKGVLLVGPPGTGKTLIAKAMAGEAGVPFFSTNGAEFVEMFVGVGAARVRDLFEQAKKSAPCIIFIDELDALGKVRNLSPNSSDEKEQTLNQLLVEMDGFDTKSHIIILAATNRPEILDPALLRAGRFDRHVLIDRPDRKGRVDILAIHSKKAKVSPECNLEEVAALTPGFSGADLANLVNEAALLATREGASEITMKHFTNALERIVAGLQKKNRLLNSFERKVVAYHEMGHAIVGIAFNKDDAIHKVSIIPRGIGSLGYTIQRPTEDRYLMTKDELQNKMSSLLAGRAAEMLIFSHLSTGAADDLMKATNIAREMVIRYGMIPDLGFVSFDDSGGPNMLGQKSFQSVSYSDKTAEEIDDQIKRLVLNSYHQAYDYLKENKKILEEASRKLLACETLSADQLQQFFEQLAPPKKSLFISYPIGMVKA